jgi:hypothetical protein
MGTYTCVRNELALTLGCDFTVGGYALSAADRVQALNFYSPVCGVDYASASFVTNPALAVTGDASQQYFQLGTPFLNGVFPVCYCAAYGGCDHHSEFTHLAGYLFIRGPRGLDHSACKAGAVCDLTAIVGTSLTSDDKIAFVSTKLGTEACAQTDSDAATEIASGHKRAVNILVDNDPHVGTDSVNVQLAVVDLPKGGVWKLCYCADYDVGNGTSCDDLREYNTEAGLITVHGADGIGVYSCIIMSSCSLQVNGQSMVVTDAVQLIEGPQTNCGIDSTSQHFGSGRTTPISGTSSTRRFEIGQPTRAGVFVVCYCPTFNVPPSVLLSIYKGVLFCVFHCAGSARG